MKAYSLLMLLVSLFLMRSGAAQCAGCNLTLVTWDDDGFYLGSVPVPGIVVTWTPGTATQPGTCSGEVECQATNCVYGKGRFTITNNSGHDIKVASPDGAVQAILHAGKWNDYDTVSNDPSGHEFVACGDNRTVLQLKWTISTPGLPDASYTYNVSVRCTSCPYDN